MRKKIKQCEKQMKRMDYEKMIIAYVSRELYWPVQDFTAEIKSLIMKTAAICDREFKMQEQELKEQLHQCKQTKQDFRDRVRIAIDDTTHLRKATWVQEIDVAMKLPASAGKNLKIDVHFSEQLCKHLKKERQRSESEYAVLKNIIRHSITVYGSAS